ncbi:O-antigen ligase family protein [Arthrobacter sp. NPDC056493]|uniref:O-antigen ligase family protein n=1 Tax=Arthrobacter sp. NPDC056493 TaxID=3345839 RepID=UPI0036725B26
MNDIIYIGVALLALAWVGLIWVRGWLVKSLVFAIVGLAFSAGYIQTLIPIRFALFAAAILAIGSLLLDRRLGYSSRTAAMGCAAPFAFLLIFGVGQIFVEVQYLDRLFRYSALYPSMFLLGWLIAKSTTTVRLANIYVYVSVLMSILAVLERLRNSFLVAGGYENSGRLIRDGSIRSIVFAEHPLVLSVLLIAAFPLVKAAIPVKWMRLLAYTVLFGGIYSTNSRGALILLAAWFALSLGFRFRLVTQNRTRALRVLSLAGASFALVSLLFGAGTDALSSTSATDASAEYRSTLYKFAAQSLLDQPWGWGLPGLPEGVYVASSHFGQLDMAKTVDSEFALIMFDFGWPGVLAIIALVIFVLRADRLRTPAGQVALLVSASGSYLALHSWVGLGSIWFLALGLAIRSHITGENSARPSASRWANRSFVPVATRTEP